MIEDSFWDQLAERGRAVTDTALPIAEWSEWSRHVEGLFESANLRDARIGRAAGLRTQKDIRGDHIAWLRDDDASPVALAALTWIEELRQRANEQLRAGLRWSEAHWARYPAAQGYDWHLDQHRGQSNRRLSFVFYLNENWASGDGGELEFSFEKSPESPRDNSDQLVTPLGGRLVLFRSDLFPHRVRPAVRARKSLTGWFRDDIQS